MVDDPIKALQKEGKKIPKNLTIAEIKKIVREKAVKEALAGLRKERPD